MSWDLLMLRLALAFVRAVHTVHVTHHVSSFMFIIHVGRITYYPGWTHAARWGAIRRGPSSPSDALVTHTSGSVTSEGRTHEAPHALDGLLDGPLPVRSKVVALEAQRDAGATSVE